MLVTVEAEIYERQAQDTDHDTYQYEYRPVLDAREILDPDGFMQRRAAQLVAEKRHNTAGENIEQDPLTDLLGGARLAVAFAETNHSEAEAAYQNHENDIRTAYTEALLKSGHISEITSDLNDPGEATIGDVAHWEIFLRAAPKNNPDVCTAEVAEEFISAALYNNPSLRNNYYMAVISPSRPDTKGSTMMVRFVGFEQTIGGKWIRKTQQVYVGNSSTQDANRLLEAWGAYGECDNPRSELDILSHPILLRKQRFPEGIAAAARMLDSFASERLGQSVFCGVPMESEAEIDRYSDLLRASQKRETQMAPEVKRLARDVYDIVAAQNLSFAEENRAYSQLLLSSLRRICSDHPEYAEAAFGAKAAKHYYLAHERVADGDTGGAEAALEAAFDNSTAVVICDTVVSEEQSQEAEQSQSEADRKEALHCLEIKINGYTIRRGVKCPACYDVTGRKVDAYETKETIRCMCKECGYHINKETGAVVRVSRIREAGKKKRKSSEQKDPKTAPLVSGRSYRLGSTYYFYTHETVDGETRPRFITDKDETITGKAAQYIERAIISFQETPLLWTLWYRTPVV